MILLAIGVCATVLAKPSPPGGSLAPMLDKVLPAVVNISTQTHTRVRRHPLLDDPFFQRFFDFPIERPRQKRSQSLGSGVIVDANRGYVLTNHHVIDGADEIKVTLRDQRQVNAVIMGQDKEVDLALLRINVDDLRALPMADSDQLRVGDFVVAIGSPFGLGQTVTYGIVSALGRSGLGIEGYENFIQTDASINPGNSGGALVDMQGRLVGINTAIVGPSGGNVGIGFAIPSNMTRAIMEHLIRHGEVRRGQLGIMMQNLDPGLARTFGLQPRGGVVVAQVIPGSAAEKAGLQVGDIIVALNGKAIKSADSLRNAIGLLGVGTRIRVDVLRNGSPLKIKARITAPQKEASANAGDMSGRLAGAILGPVAADHPLAGRVEGVEVISIERGSAAWSAGLRRGDIVVSVNQQPVSSVAEVATALQRNADRLLLNIRRGNGSMFVLIQ